MTEDKKKNIFIIGQGAAASALAKKLKQNAEIGQIYITYGNSVISEDFKNIDIREDDLTGLLKFALEAEIDLTIPISKKTLRADVVSFFQSNGQNIFGPAKEACNIAINNGAGKKFLYKIHAQTSKFGIFDKIQQAEDFLKSANYPVTIKCREYSDITKDRLVCPTISLASEYLSTLFSKNETDILIEEFTFGRNFTIYFVTDGYSAVPLTSVANYKFTQDGDGGVSTNGIGCFAPDYKISDVVIQRVENIVRNTLVSLEKKGEPYVGILGLECILTGEDKFFVSEFKPFLQEHDAATVLNMCEDNLLEIFTACVNGLFADEYETIKMNGLSSVSAVVLSRLADKEIKGLDAVDDIENINYINALKKDNRIFTTNKGAVFTLTRSASTLSRAKEYLYDDLSQIDFEGIKYRKDIAEINPNLLY